MKIFCVHHCERKYARSANRACPRMRVNSIGRKLGRDESLVVFCETQDEERFEECVPTEDDL